MNLEFCPSDRRLNSYCLIDIHPADPVNVHSPPTDIELYQALQTGQQEALAALYDRYGSLVYRLGLKILSTPQEAEDLTQEIFLTLWRGRSYNPSRGSMSSFLTTLTRSRAIDRLRSRRSTVKFLQRWSQIMTTDTTPSPFESASLNQRSDYVRQALAQLPDKQRQVLEMAYYEGLTQTEIADRLNKPLGTVKSWSRQGLLTLRKHLQPWLG